MLTRRYNAFKNVSKLPTLRNCTSGENMDFWLSRKHHSRPVRLKPVCAHLRESRSLLIGPVPTMPSRPLQPVYSSSWPPPPLSTRSPQQLAFCPPLPCSPHGQGHTLTLLVGRRHGAPAFASRAAAGLLGGVTLRLQGLWRRWGGGSCVLPGRLMDFADLLREAGREGSILTGRPGATEMRGSLPGLCT